MYLSSNISSTESNVNICMGKLWIAIDSSSKLQLYQNYCMATPFKL